MNTFKDKWGLVPMTAADWHLGKNENLGSELNCVKQFGLHLLYKCMCKNTKKKKKKLLTSASSSRQCRILLVLEERASKKVTKGSSINM